MRLLLSMFSKVGNFISLSSRSGMLCCAALFVFIGMYASFLIPFVVHDGLSSFFSDSANYLIMARYLSPWHEASRAVVSAWPIQDFPPFFPFVLAVLGAACDYTLAHMVTVFFLLLSIPLVFIFARGMFAANHQALLIVSIFCLSPSAWFNSMGILSENLYLFLSLLTLIFFDRSDLSGKTNPGKINLYIFGLLLALLMLTRTIGVAMLLAFMIICIMRWRRGSLDWPYFVIPLFSSFALIAASWWAHSTTVPSQYITQVGGLLGSETGTIKVSWDITEQLEAFYDNWLGGLLNYWTDQALVATSIIMLFGLFSLLGLCIRLGQGKLDALYVSLYLLVLFIWPHPGHMGRFIYPVLCILLMHSFYFLYVFIRRVKLERGDTAVSIAMLLALAAVLPTLSYTWHRYKAGEESGYHRIKEFYVTHDLKQAQQIAATKQAMILEMERMRKTTAPDAVILCFEPVYIALLADRIGREITFARDPAGELYMELDPAVDYIYLTRLHPRRARKDMNGMQYINSMYIQQYVPDRANLLWLHRSAENDERFSAFFEIMD